MVVSRSKIVSLRMIVWSGTAVERCPSVSFVSGVELVSDVFCSVGLVGDDLDDIKLVGIAVVVCRNAAVMLFALSFAMFCVVSVAFCGVFSSGKPKTILMLKRKVGNGNAVRSGVIPRKG